MAELTRCPQCGCNMPPDSPAGLCPDCLLGAGLAASDPVFDQQPLTEARPASTFVPPKPHELADRFPQFEILDLLGYGGMGAVYKARQKSLDRLVALKIIKPDAADDPGFAERFAREARALAKLNHSNIVSVHDSGQSEGLYYFVMEYVDGTNLRRLIESKELKPEEAIEVIPQVCEALQYAHEEGIVHRDIKPENILVDSKGRVKIADFGLAKLLGTTSIDQHTLTGTHQVMGTPRYMAPEQMEGSKAVDHRADIYSLGVVFYEMLTGELPMGSFEPPSRKVQVDTRLDEIVLRSLAKEPERRYQRASDVKSDVELVSRHADRLQPAAPREGQVDGEPPQDQSAVDSELVTAILFVLFVGSAFGCFLSIMPWARVQMEALPAASRDLGIESGVTRTFDAAGHTFVLPILGSLMAAVLLLVSFVLTLKGRYPSAFRAVLAGATGLMLAGTSTLIYCMAPSPRAPDEYVGMLRSLNQADIQTDSAMHDLHIMKRQGRIDVRIDVQEPGCALALLAGIALVVAAMFEMRSVLQLQTAECNPTAMIRGPTTALRCAAWSSPFALLVLIGMYFARVSAYPGPDDPLAIAFVLLAVAQGVHTLLLTPLILVGVSKMTSRQSIGWARLSSIAAMLPVGLSAVIGIPAGVWLLDVLARGEVIAAFDRSPAKKPHAQPPGMIVRYPAIGMIVAGALGCLAALAILGFVVIEELTSTNVSLGEIVGPGILCLLALGLSGGTIVAGMKMLQLEQYEFAISFAFIAMLVPLNPIAVPIGIWSLVVLLRRDVKEAFGLEAKEPQESSESAADWSPLVLGLVVLVPLMALIAFGMHMTESAWVLAALALPWVCLGIAGISTDDTPQEKAVTWLAVICFLMSLGLIAYGIAIEQSAWPLAGLAVGVAGAFTGMMLQELSGEEKKDQGRDAIANAAEQVKAVDGQLAEMIADDDDDEAEDSPEENLQWAAFWIGVVGALRSWSLLSDGPRALNQIVHGESISSIDDLLVSLTGPVLLVGAIAMYHARSFALSVLVSVLCMVSGSCLAVILGIWSLFTLFNEDVQKLFLGEDQSPDSPTGSSSAKPMMPVGYGNAIGSTISQAWTDWWRERDLLFTRAVQIVLLILHIACLFAFISFRAQASGYKDFPFYRHAIGLPSPWLSLDTTGGPNASFDYSIHWSSPAWLAAALGLALCYIYCRIERVRNPDAGYWYRPEAFLLVWGVLALASIGLGAGMGQLAMHDRSAKLGNHEASPDLQSKTEQVVEQVADRIQDKIERHADRDKTAKVEAPDPELTPLTRAIVEGDIDRVKELLDEGASINTKDTAGQTSLMKAIISGNRSLALTLVVLGADLTEQDERGRTALMYAVEAKDKVFCSRLREIQEITYEPNADERRSQLRAFSGVERTLLDGRDFDLRNLDCFDLERQTDANGETASLIAARIGDWELYSDVATHVDSLRARDKKGRTIAMHAALHGHSKWFEFLDGSRFFGIAGKINLYVGETIPFDVDQLALTDSDGKTTLQIAEEHGHKVIADILRRHLQAIVDNQTAEIDKGGDDVADHLELRRLAWSALGETEREREDADEAKDEID